MNGIVDVIFKVAAIFGIGVSAATFIGNKTDATAATLQADLKPVELRVGTLEAWRGGAEVKLEIITKTLERIEEKIDTIGGWNKPAVVESTAPLIRGILPDGSPKNAKNN